MTNTIEYKEAAVEVLDVIQHMDEEMIADIPLDFIKQLKENKSETYKSTIDFKKDLKDNDLKHLTKVILAFIYRDYICKTEEEKQNFEKTLITPDLYNNQIFKDKINQSTDVSEDVTKLLPKKIQKNFFQKIFDKILKRN